MKPFVLVLILIMVKFCFLSITIAQPYIEGGKTRHRFAQMNLGFEQRLFLGGNAASEFENELGQIKSLTLPNHHESRFIIGGTHFWGHTDFYISIPFISLSKNGYKTGVETGAKFFPWRIEKKQIRPFIGIAWLPINYQQGEGVVMNRSKFPLTTGVNYHTKNLLLELGIGYIKNNQLNYFINEQYKTKVQFNSFWCSVSLKMMLETTLSAEKDWLSGRTRKLTDTLSVLRELNGITLGIGLSSAFFLKSSPYLSNRAPYADNHKVANVFPELAIGYYFHKPDLQFNLSWRSINSEIKAFNFSQRVNRKALSLEAFKFFADYHGFATFAGISLSQEWLSAFEIYQQNAAQTKKKGIFPGLTFGWDIRPNRLQTWYLRTNIRYFPNLNLIMKDGSKHPLDQWEFNFIQLVIFPGRLFK